MNPKNSSFAQSVVPTHNYGNAPPLDVLIVPGGLGSRAPDLNSTSEFIARVYPKLQYLITVCTGSAVVASTGILDGKLATTNKASWYATIAPYPKVKWVHHARWTIDGKIWTSSGISAGIDAILAFIEAKYGFDEAKTVTSLMEYERHPQPDWDPFVDIFNSSSRA